MPICNELFKTVPLDALELGVCIVAAFLILVVVEIEKWMRRRFAHDPARK
ncbi:MAG: cation transporting ATPase C-terminal domain-containing protein [Steroidobacteraceae bacterium]